MQYGVPISAIQKLYLSQFCACFDSTGKRRPQVTSHPNPILTSMVSGIQTDIACPNWSRGVAATPTFSHRQSSYRKMRFAFSLKTGQFCYFIGWNWPNEPQNDPNGLCIRIHISFELGKVSSASKSAAFIILGVKNVWLTVAFLRHFYPGLLRQIFNS